MTAGSRNSTGKNIFLADMALVIVAFTWGAGVPVCAVLARGITPLWAVALRCLFSSFFLILFFHRRIVTSTLQDWKISSLLSIIMICVFSSMSFGLVYSTASKQSFIGGLNVIMVPLMIWGLYKHKPSNWIFMSAAITTLGLMVMGFTPGMEFNFGDILSFFMAIFYAIQYIGAGYCARRVDPLRLVALHVIMLAIAMTVLALIFEPLPNPAEFNLKIWLSLLYLSLCNTILCFTVQFKAQRVTPDTHVSIILSLEGFFGYLVAVVSGQDPFVLQGAVGGLLMMTGILLTELEGVFKKS